MRTTYKSLDNSTEKDYLDMSLSDWAKEQLRDKDHNLLETEEAKFFKTMRDMIDGCLPAETANALKKVWLYHVFKNLPEAGEAIGLTAANIAIKYSIAPETKEWFKSQIRQAEDRRDLLIGMRNDYAQILAKNGQGECQGYFEVMNELHTRSKNPVGATHIVDELNLIHKEIFTSTLTD